MPTHLQPNVDRTPEFPPRPPTAFERRVYEVVRRIPVGKVMTYADVARAVGCGSGRAIGQALRRNPYAPDVPCHRVIRSDLRLGGFHGQTDGAEIARKRALLAREGVHFSDRGRASGSAVHNRLRGQASATYRPLAPSCAGAFR